MELYGISKEQLYLFNNGLDYESYNIFGAHFIKHEGKDGVRFLVYAPNAVKVFVVGEFNEWKKTEKCEMTKIDDTGCFIVFIEGLKQYDMYKYLITTSEYRDIYKADPYAFHAEVRPGTASKVYDIEEPFQWTDDAFIKERSKADHFNKPKNIYEVHFGSFMQRGTDIWRDKPDDVPAADFLTYRELAEKLIPYVKEMGYTHIEIMPLNEHPYDGSWGYQTTGYFAMTSRYGIPHDFMYFVNESHKAGIKVLLDWVPGHFCMDEHGLRFFDGGRVYDGKEHKHWGTMTFNYNKKEVLSFLNSSAFFLLDKFHVDGIRFDGVSSMLYLNYGVDNPNEKVFNKYGDEGNLEAISFIQNLNKLIGEKYKGVITMAEESTAWPNVTKPADIGGLGFHYKWDMGWMHDTLNYLRSDFPYREQNHNMFTFSMSYAEAENYILSLSHDEVVHGKASIINKMPGDYDEKFAQVKVLLAYQLTRTGAKLNFMGNEIPEFIEWRFYESLEWFLLNNEKHKKHHEFVKYLNNLYLKEKAFYEKDMRVWEGFDWIDAGNAKQHIFIYERIALDPKDRCIVILNFGKDEIEKFKLGVNIPGKYEEIINSNDLKWGGTGTCINEEIIVSKNVAEDEATRGDEATRRGELREPDGEATRRGEHCEPDGEATRKDEATRRGKTVQWTIFHCEPAPKIHGRENYIEIKLPKLSAVILKLK
ncbi:MAG: 1,4-alpha-glucan branching protein GlgB [Lachnospiraceae bacterium]|nr:1,4-alpha-glucan branching protein GlgB [Lachnospiraceae bacterium]